MERLVSALYIYSEIGVRVQTVSRLPYYQGPGLFTHFCVITRLDSSRGLDNELWVSERLESSYCVRMSVWHSRTAQTESSGVEMIFNGSLKEMVIMTVRCSSTNTFCQYLLTFTCIAFSSSKMTKTCIKGTMRCEVYSKYSQVMLALCEKQTKFTLSRYYLVIFPSSGLKLNNWNSGLNSRTELDKFMNKSFIPVLWNGSMD